MKQQPRPAESPKGDSRHRVRSREDKKFKRTPPSIRRVRSCFFRKLGHSLSTPEVFGITFRAGLAGPALPELRAAMAQKALRAAMARRKKKPSSSFLSPRRSSSSAQTGATAARCSRAFPSNEAIQLRNPYERRLRADWRTRRTGSQLLNEELRRLKPQQRFVSMKEAGRCHSRAILPGSHLDSVCDQGGSNRQGRGDEQHFENELFHLAKGEVSAR